MEAVKMKLQTKEFQNLLTCLETNCKVSLKNDLTKFLKHIKNMNQKNPEDVLKMMKMVIGILKKTGEKELLKCQIQKCADKLIAQQIKASRNAVKEIKKLEKLLKDEQKKIKQIH